MSLLCLLLSLFGLLQKLLSRIVIILALSRLAGSNQAQLTHMGASYLASTRTRRSLEGAEAFSRKQLSVALIGLITSTLGGL